MADQDNIEMEPVVGSRRIAALGYDLDSATMKCRFPNGAEYLYYGVGHDVYAAVRHAPSVGQAFGALIVGSYDYERIA